MNREHFRDEHFQRGQRRGGRGINGSAQRVQQAAHLIGRANAVRQQCVIQRLVPASSPSAWPTRCNSARTQSTWIFGAARFPGSAQAVSPAQAARRRGISHQKMAWPRCSNRCAMAEKSSQTAPVLHISKSGRGKCSPFSKAGSMARTGQNEASMPIASACCSSLSLHSMRQGVHQAPSG